MKTSKQAVRAVVNVVAPVVAPMMVDAITSTIKKKDEDVLRKIAQQIADQACVKINKNTQKVETPTVMYKAQWVLEEVITILQGRV